MPQGTQDVSQHQPGMNGWMDEQKNLFRQNLVYAAWLYADHPNDVPFKYTKTEYMLQKPKHRHELQHSGVQIKQKYVFGTNISEVLLHRIIRPVQSTAF